MMPSHSQMLACLFALSSLLPTTLAAALPQGPESEPFGRAPLASAVNSIYPPEGIDYTIPDTAYVMNFHSRGGPEVQLPIPHASLAECVQTGVIEINSLIAASTSDTKFDYSKKDADAGVFHHDGVQARFQPAIHSPTYAEARVLLRGLLGAFEDAGCKETARVTAFQVDFETSKRNPIATIDLTVYQQQEPQQQVQVN